MSEGKLTNFTLNEFEKILPRILNNSFETEPWTRLDIEIDGKTIDKQCVSEIFIGEEVRYNMSRHLIKVNGKQEEQKGSGILITTGAGSTGWYESALRYRKTKEEPFSKDKKEARFVLTEPFSGRLSKSKMAQGSFKGKENIEIISLSDSQAVLSIDSLEIIKLREGSKIKIKFGEDLKVIKSKK